MTSQAVGVEDVHVAMPRQPQSAERRWRRAYIEREIPASNLIDELAFDRFQTAEKLQAALHLEEQAIGRRDAQLRGQLMAPSSQGPETIF